MAIKNEKRKINVGIVGSSHSYGNNGVPCTPLVQAELQRLLPEYNFITCAQPGKGSERFANAIMYLKCKKVDAILIENVANRASRYIYTGDYFKQDHPIDNLIFDYLNFDTDLNTKNCIYTTTAARHELLSFLPKKYYTIWADVNQTLIDDDSYATISLVDIYYADMLCNDLGIIPIHWSIFGAPGYRSDHPTYKSVYDFLQKKLKVDPHQSKHLWSHDNMHLNHFWQAKMIEHYLIPTIKNKIT